MTLQCVWSFKNKESPKLHKKNRFHLLATIYFLSSNMKIVNVSLQLLFKVGDCDICFVLITYKDVNFMC
jgi:hypothetical protein